MKFILENSGLSQQKLTELLSMIDPNEFKIDWFTISMESLDDRHSSNECEGFVIKCKFI